MQVAVLNEEVFASLTSSLEHLRNVSARQLLSTRLAMMMAETEALDSFFSQQFDNASKRNVFARLVELACMNLLK